MQSCNKQKEPKQTKKAIPFKFEWNFQAKYANKQYFTQAGEKGQYIKRGKGEYGVMICSCQPLPASGLHSIHVKLVVATNIGLGLVLAQNRLRQACIGINSSISTAYSMQKWQGRFFNGKQPYIGPFSRDIQLIVDMDNYEIQWRFYKEHCEKHRQHQKELKDSVKIQINQHLKGKQLCFFVQMHGYGSSIELMDQ